MLIGPIFSLPHYGSNGGGSGIENSDLIFFHDVPEPIRVGVGYMTPVAPKANGP